MCNGHIQRQRTSRGGWLTILVTGIVVSHVTWSFAAPLLPDATLFPVPSGSPPGGTVVAGGSPVPFTATTFVGELTSTVLNNDPTNPLGGLTFTYVLQDDVASTGDIEGLFISSFAGASLDLDYASNSGNVPPTYVNRSSGGGSAIGYFFSPPPVGAGELQPGQASEVLVVYTNSHVFAASVATVTDGSGTQVASFATPALSGDVNFDGVVNGLDIALVASHWLQSGTLVAGDANFDGVVNGLDISLISSNWLQSAGSPAGASASAPEPSTAVLAACGALALLARRRRHQ
jgi:hypothetical protein